MAHLHTDMERFDVHVVVEVCEIVIESATIVLNASFSLQKFLTEANEGNKRASPTLQLLRNLRFLL